MLDPETHVKAFIMKDGRMWNVNLLNELFWKEEEAEFIQQTHSYQSKWW